FDRDALLRVMTAALRDPAHVIGASNHVERGVVPDFVAPDFVGDGLKAVPNLTGLFERLASARALMDSRLAWRHLGNSFGPASGTIVWRRDALLKAQGFSAVAADPHLDLMLKLQTPGIEGAGRFDRSVDVFGSVGPGSVPRALKAAGRRQRATLEILSALI